MDSARHFIKRIMNPHFLNETASYDVASAIHQSLTPGTYTAACAPVATTSITAPEAVTLSVAPAVWRQVLLEDHNAAADADAAATTATAAPGSSLYTLSRSSHAAAGAYTRPLTSST